MFQEFGLHVPVQRPLTSRRRLMAGCHTGNVLLGAPPRCPRCLFQQTCDPWPRHPPLLTFCRHSFKSGTTIIKEAFWIRLVWGDLVVVAVGRWKTSQSANYRSFLLTSATLSKVCKIFLLFFFFIFIFIFLAVCMLYFRPRPLFFSVPFIDLIWKCPIAFI